MTWKPYRPKSLEVPDGRWTIIRTRPTQTTYGIAIPAILHKDDDHLTTIEVYADGLINCWEPLDLDIFTQKVSKGWVKTESAKDKFVNISNLGRAKIVDGSWLLTPDDIVAQVHQALAKLNPDQENLIDFQGENTEIRNGVRVGKLSIPNDKPYRIDNTLGLIIGDEVPVFVNTEGICRLTRWFVYSDGSSKLGTQGSVVSTEEIADKVVSGQITTSVRDGKWIMADGLGVFRTSESTWFVDADERVREVYDKLDILNGKQGTVELCLQEYKRFEQYPSPERQEILHHSYHSVPKHLRIFCGNMETQDTPIRRILGITS